MAILLAVVDNRTDQVRRYEFEIPAPALPLSVLVAARMAVRRAREKGFEGSIRRASVHRGVSYISPNSARNVFVPDGSSVVVTVSGSDVWELDV